MVRHCPVCGPKLSICCSVIAIWGIIQLLLMGVFFYVEAGPFVDEITFNETMAKHSTDKELSKIIHTSYNQQAYNCWIAAFLYIVTLIFTASQLMCNRDKMVSTDRLNNYGPAPPIQQDQDEQAGIRFRDTDDQTFMSSQS